jgi:RalA-binding protein 1
MFEKRNDSMQKSVDIETVEETIDFTLQTAAIDDTKTPQEIIADSTSVQIQAASVTIPNDFEKVSVAENGFLTLHKNHPQYSSLIRLQLENQELLNWKQTLQAKIQAERAECLKLKKLVDANELVQESQPTLSSNDPEIERLIEHYMKENSLLEQKRQLLAKEVFDENLSLIQMQVEYQMKQIIH